MKNIEYRTSTIEHSRMVGACHWALNVGCWMLEVPKFLLVFAIRAYQLTISPAQASLFGSAAGCRFTPTCSQYAVEAVQAHGSLVGTVLAAKRICRCHPWGGCGHDPVPPAGIKIKHSNPGILGFDR